MKGWRSIPKIPPRPPPQKQNKTKQNETKTNKQKKKNWLNGIKVMGDTRL